MAYRSRLSGLLRQSASVFRTSAQPSSWAAALPITHVICRDMSTSKLFIGGMSFVTDESSLRQAFVAHGDVIDAKIILDRETGRSRGFGFVTFADESQAESAISAMDGKVLDGRVIRVDYAISKSRPAFQPSSGFGPAGGFSQGGGFGQGGYGQGGFGANAEGQAGAGFGGQGSYGQGGFAQASHNENIARGGGIAEQGVPSTSVNPGFPQLDNPPIVGHGVDASLPDESWNDFLTKVDNLAGDSKPENSMEGVKEFDFEHNESDRQATSS